MSDTSDVVPILKEMWEMQQAGKLPMFTIYDHPLDFPEDYVARLFECGKETRATSTIICAKKLEVLRYIMSDELHLTCLMRSPDDDPMIVETWL